MKKYIIISFIVVKANEQEKRAAEQEVNHINRVYTVITQYKKF